MAAYERHSSRCTKCTIPLEMSGRGPLCGRGYKYARDVANYLFAQKGEHFSVVAREREKLVQVKIPRNAFAVHNLLAAIEAGLHLYIRKAITSDLYHTPQPGTKHFQPQNHAPKLKRYKIIERKPRTVQHPVPLHHSLLRYPRHVRYKFSNVQADRSQGEDSNAYLL